MELFLKILGCVCLLGLILIGAVLFFAARLRRGLRELTEMAQGMQGAATPPRLHLIPAAQPDWKDPEKIASLAAPLAELGFEEAGAFSTREMPDLLLRALVHIPENAYALVYEHPQAGAWLDFYSRYEDGTTMTYTNCPQAGQVDQRPGHGKTVAPELEPPVLWRRFLAERPQRAMKRVSAESFAADFERAYADEMDWRNSRGYTDDEVRRVLEAGGSEAVSDEDVEAVRETMNQQAREGLDEGLRERFRAHSGMTHEAWDEIEDRIVFIHDGLSGEDLEGIFEEWVEEFPGGAGEVKTPAGLSGREAFAAMNELLSEAEQFEKVGEMKEPIPVDVYAAPGGNDYDEDEDEGEE